MTIIIENMKNRKISLIIDLVLNFICWFALSVLIINYFTRNLIIILAGSLFTALLLTLIIAKTFKPKKKDKECEKYINQFIYNDEAYSMKIISEALASRYTIIKHKGFFSINKTAVFVSFKPSKLSHENLASIYSAGKKYNKILVMTIDGFEKQALAAISVLMPIIKVVGFEKVYLMLKALNALPEITVELKKNKKNFKEIFIFALSKDKSRGYLMIAFLLLISSFISKMSIYYLAFALLNMVLSVICKLNLVNKSKNPES